MALPAAVILTVQGSPCTVKIKNDDRMWVCHVGAAMGAAMRLRGKGGDKLGNLQKAWDFLELALGMYIQGDKRWIGCDSF